MIKWSMLSRKTVIWASSALTISLFVEFQTPPVDPIDWQILAVLIGVGIILPTVIDSYLDF